MNINRKYISKKNTYAGRNNPKYIVIHETDNFNRGANAERHASAQCAGHLSTSVHYYVDKEGVYQAAEHSDGTYSIGKEYGGKHAVRDANNCNSINIEICVNPDGDYTAARRNCIELVRQLMKEAGIPAERVIRHYDAKGKYCPRKMMDNPAWWTDFKKQIGQITTNKPKPVASVQPEQWYRVGTDWKNGICVGQTGAYKIKQNAIIACKPVQKVFDSVGNVVYPDKIPNPYPKPTRVIKYRGKGLPLMKGDDVRWVQWELVEAGYDIKIDGKFGPASDEALRDFQKTHGLEVDGKCGPATREKLTAA